MWTQVLISPELGSSPGKIMPAPRAHIHEGTMLPPEVTVGSLCTEEMKCPGRLKIDLAHLKHIYNFTVFSGFIPSTVKEKHQMKQ